MYVVAQGVRAVAKDTHTFQNGDVVYRASFGGGQGGLVNVNMDRQWWEQIVPFEVVYSIQLDVTTSGYRNFVDLVGLAIEEQKKKG